MKNMTAEAKRLKDELAALEQMPDEAIDTADIPEITDWSQAERGRFFRPIKKSVTIRLDADVLDWFKSQGGKYQTQVNKALRLYMNSKERRAG
jgi:uncharacterized protein (DUF4415 family)